MTRDDIIKLAREAEFYGDGRFLVCSHEELERFAALAVAAEREACAKRLEAVGCDHCAANIRLRGKEHDQR